MHWPTNGVSNFELISQNRIICSNLYGSGCILNFKWPLSSANIYSHKTLNYVKSTGAHASGFAGAELKSIQRITGLDPAGYKDIQLI